MATNRGWTSARQENDSEGLMIDGRASCKMLQIVDFTGCFPFPVVWRPLLMADRSSAPLWLVFLSLSMVLSGIDPVCARQADDRQELKFLIETGEYQEAIDWVEEEPGIYPLLEARVFRETGRLSDALQTLSKHPRFASDDPDLLSMAGGLEVELGRSASAEKKFKKVLKVAPDHFEAMCQLGLLMIAQGKREEGHKLLRKVLDTYKKMSRPEAQKLSPEQFVWFGKACEGLQRFRDAYEVMYDSALYQDPKSVAAHVASGWALFHKYNYPDARSHFRDALERNSRNVNALIGLARATWADFRFPGDRGEEVQELINRARFIWEKNPELLLLEGDQAFSAEHWNRAEQRYREVIDLAPENLTAKGLLAAVLWSTARIDEFQELVQQVESGHPAPAIFHVTLAERLVDRFFYRESAEHALKAIEFDPGHPKSYAIFAINALRSGMEEKGREILEEAWVRDKYNVWVKNTRTLMDHIDEKFTSSDEDGLIIRMRTDEEPFLMPYLRPLLIETRTILDRDYEIAMLRPLTVEDFSDHSYFSARSIGLPGLAASGVCFGALVTLTTPNAIPGNWGAVAVHEFAHVATLQKAKHRIPRWFGEGLSVLEEGRTEPRWRRAEPVLVSSEFHGGTMRGIEDLQGAFTNPRWRGEILVGYVQSGLICEMIVEKHGLDAINKMLDGYSQGRTTGQVIEEVLGQTTQQFDDQTKSWLKKRVAAAGIGPSFNQRHIDNLRREAEDRTRDARAWAWLASAYLMSNRKADAELAIGKSEKLDSDHPDLLAVRGLMQMKDGLTDSALKSLRAAIDGDSIWGWRCRLLVAKTLRDQGDSQEAMELYAEATRMAPSGVRSPVGGRSPWIALATIQKDLGFPDEAVKSLRSQIRHDRDDARTRLLLAETLADQADWEGVIDAAWDLPFIDPYNDKGHDLLARGYIGIEAWGKAKRELQARLSSETPQLGEIYPDLSWVLWKLGDSEEARKIARRALRLKPSAVRPRQVLDAVGEDDAGDDG